MSATPFHRLHAAQLQATRKPAKVYERKQSRTTITDCFGMFWITGMRSASSAESCRISLCWKRLQFQKASARKAWRHIVRWKFDQTGEIGWNPVKSTRKKHWTHVLRSREASAQKTIPLSNHNLQVFRNIGRTGRTVGPVALEALDSNMTQREAQRTWHRGALRNSKSRFAWQVLFAPNGTFPGSKLMNWRNFQWLWQFSCLGSQDSPLQTCWGTHHIDQSTPDVSTHKRNAPSWPIPRWPMVTMLLWDDTRQDIMDRRPERCCLRRQVIQRPAGGHAWWRIFYWSFLQVYRVYKCLQSLRITVTVCWNLLDNWKKCKNM